MKKPLLTIASMIFLSSCSTHSGSGSTTVTPSGTTSTFNITIAGHTYNLTENTSVIPVTTSIIATTADAENVTYGTGNSYPNTIFQSYIQSLNSNQILFSALGIKPDLSTAIGTYRVGVYPDPAVSGGYISFYSPVQIRDYGDGGKLYTSADTTSSITISISNGSEVKGTFSLSLYYNGSYYPATGDFDYKH